MLLKAKAAYSTWFVVFNDFPKVHRPTLGKKIENYFLELLELIFLSLYLPPSQKITKLHEVAARMDGLKFLLQIAWENKCIQHDRYALLSEQLQEIGKMIGGWRKGIENRISNKTPA